MTTTTIELFNTKSRSICTRIIQCTDEERVVIFYDNLLNRMTETMIRNMFSKWLNDNLNNSSGSMENMMNKIFDLKACLKLRCYKNVLKSKSPYKTDWIVTIHPFSDDKICVALNDVDYRVDQCIQMFIKKNLFLSCKKDIGGGSTAEYSCFTYDKLLECLLNRFKIAAQLIYYQYIILYKILSSSYRSSSSSSEDEDSKNRFMDHIEHFTERITIQIQNLKNNKPKFIIDHDLNSLNKLLDRLKDITIEMKARNEEDDDEESIKSILNDIHTAFIDPNGTLYSSITEVVYKNYKYISF